MYRGSAGHSQQRGSAGNSQMPAQHRGAPRRGFTWGLYWDEAADAAFAAEEIAAAQSEDALVPTPGNSMEPTTRRATLRAVDRFLSVTNLVRDLVHDPADVLAGSHVLHIPFASLSSCPLHLEARMKQGDFQMPLHSDMSNRRPELILDCLAHLAHEELLLLCPPAPRDPTHTAARLAKRRLRVRLVDRDSKPYFFTPLGDLKADKIGRMVVVKGAVIRASSLRPYVEAMPFECPRCKEASKVMVPLADGRYKPPTECPARGCRVKALMPVRSEAITRDFQKIRLQETPEDSLEELYGRVPRTVEVELLDDLVDSCVPGDHVKVVGMVKSVEVQTDGGGFGKGGSSKPKCTYLLFIEALSVNNAKAAAGGGASGRKGGVDGAAAGGSSERENEAVADGLESLNSSMAFSVRDLQEIARLHAKWRGRMFEVLTASMCPTIFGHEVVKTGLALGLFGGSQRALAELSNASSLVGKRSDIHVLVVGDPGMGKSQMLTAASIIAPRGVYVCGNATSSSGLTVTVVRDQATGDFALEAGALVMGDQGCCCIDEFDKMSSAEHQALLEAMEQQTISVAKAGIVCSLSARTAVLAAANPVSGHYNRSRTVCENLKLPSNILSRFDLVFVLLDKPNEHMDRLLSLHVMALHAGRDGSGAKRMAEAGAAGGGAAFAGEDGYDSWRKQDGADGLAVRLRETAAKLGDHELLTPSQLRKYIAYARAHVQPALTDRARAVLEDFYLQLRAKQRGGDSVPVTARQLESLIRLAEARARMELREEVSEADAIDAIAVVRETIIYDTLADLVGGAHVAPGGQAVGVGAAPWPGPAPAKRPSHRKVAQDFMSYLDHDANRRGSAMYTFPELQEAMHASGLVNPRPTFREFIEALNIEGFLLMRGPNYLLQGTPMSQGRGTWG